MEHIDNTTYNITSSPISVGIKAKPFVKWAGGKSQISDRIIERLPSGIGKSIDKFAEPMVGGGAILLSMLARYNFKEVFISDVNAELINVYKTIASDCNALAEVLNDKEKVYCYLDAENQKKYYYDERAKYNKLSALPQKSQQIERAGLFVFLNKTCFNGLYRVNKKGEFNVPIGSYKNPKIFELDNLLKISTLLSNINIVTGDYNLCSDFVDENTFVYFDPPYRPLNKTASFTSYIEGGFNDEDQVRLAEFYKSLSDNGAKVMMSNSDPKNTDPSDNFFDDLYNGFNIQRIEAKRMINSNGKKRGSVTELLITNY